MAQRAYHRQRSSLHEALVGAWPADRIRAFVHASIRRLSQRRGRRYICRPDVPRCIADRLRHRRGFEIGVDWTVGTSGHDRKGGSSVMRTFTIALVLIAVVPLAAQRGPRGAEPLVIDHQAGFEPIFDGKTLAGWDGDPAFWKVADGAIVGQSSPENAVKENTFIIWRGGEPKDFELKV